MALYYPELIDYYDNITPKEFDNDAEAIEYYKKKYKERLDAVVKDEYPYSKVVWG